MSSVYYSKKRARCVNFYDRMFVFYANIVSALGILTHVQAVRSGLGIRHQKLDYWITARDKEADELSVAAPISPICNLELTFVFYPWYISACLIHEDAYIGM